MASRVISETKHYPMNSGDHPLSYAHNSDYQRQAVDATKDKVWKAILENLNIDAKSSFNVADFGCSIGPNTFAAVQNIIDAVKLKHKTLSTFDFHAFFCDHTNNDFNTLFKTLPLPRTYFAAGVPGSFHDRQFPARFLHLAHSSYAVHWLSSVPNEVVDRNSIAFNGSRIHCIGAGKEVAEAYMRQFYDDMDRFLAARAEEILGGGLLMILSPSLPNEPSLHLQTGSSIFFETLGECLGDMVIEGLVSKERAEMFNLPMYFPSSKELETIIEKNGSFDIKELESFSHCHAKNYMNSTSDVHKFTTMLRATVEGLLNEHFGWDSNNVDDLFNRYTAKFESNFKEFREQIHSRTEVFIVLKRK